MAWISHMRCIDQPRPYIEEQIRLTHDQAMRLCFEISECKFFRADMGINSHVRALAAYNAGRPWDFLAGSHLFGYLVPYEKRLLTTQGNRGDE